jgi:hypothetical protein
MGEIISRSHLGIVPVTPIVIHGPGPYDYSPRLPPVLGPARDLSMLANAIANPAQRHSEVGLRRAEAKAAWFKTRMEVRRP